MQKKKMVLALAFFLFVFLAAQPAWAARQAAKLLPEDAATNDQFGISVAISGNTAVVGKPYDDANGDNSGSAYIFTRDANGDWSQTAKLLPSDGATETDLELLRGHRWEHGRNRGTQWGMVRRLSTRCRLHLLSRPRR